jgi:hypothetical protein
VDFWYKLNRAFMWAKDGRRVQVGQAVVQEGGRQAVGIQLPSGRMLYYRHIRREKYKGASNSSPAPTASSGTAADRSGNGSTEAASASMVGYWPRT